MTYPAITAFHAGILAFIYLGLSVWVIAGRFTKQTSLGDGGDKAMLRRIRSHANFQEYVPLAIILIGFLEAGGGSRTLVQVMLTVLVVVRLMHPIGMVARPNSPQQYIFRAGAMISTLSIIGITAIMLLVRAA